MIDLTNALQYVDDNKDELINLIKELCLIPSFSHEEKQKAEFVQKWLKDNGIDSFIDDAYNVISEMNVTSDSVVSILMAHTDTVFPDKVGFVCVEDGDKLAAPGVGDDTSNLAELLLIMKYIYSNGLSSNTPLVFVANSCEEGLGNLDGTKAVCKRYEGRIKELISFDGSYESIVNKAVGSTRYEITVKTEGGHSYGAFGNRNAIAYASSLISTLYDYKVPTRGKSTYNVGVISGGTSVNTIAQECKFLFEFRSDNSEDLKEMMELFGATIAAYKKMGIVVEVKVLGVRPSDGDINKEDHDALINKAAEILKKYAGKEIELRSGSTDCNIPLSLGIPSICFGGYLGKGSHTREEYVLKSTLPIGMKAVMEFVLTYFD